GTEFAKNIPQERVAFYQRFYPIEFEGASYSRIYSYDGRYLGEPRMNAADLERYFRDSILPSTRSFNRRVNLARGWERTTYNSESAALFEIMKVKTNNDHE